MFHRLVRSGKWIIDNLGRAFDVSEVAKWVAAGGLPGALSAAYLWYSEAMISPVVYITVPGAFAALGLGVYHSYIGLSERRRANEQAPNVAIDWGIETDDNSLRLRIKNQSYKTQHLSKVTIGAFKIAQSSLSIAPIQVAWSFGDGFLKQFGGATAALFRVEDGVLKITQHDMSVVEHPISLFLPCEIHFRVSLDIDEFYWSLIAVAYVNEQGCLRKEKSRLNILEPRRR